MNKYTIKQVSGILNISKDTLRYYDKMGLISPNREENKYRLYTDETLMELMYIQVLKYAGFSLIEIKELMANKNKEVQSQTCKNETIQMLEHKNKQSLDKITQLNKIVSLLNFSIAFFKGEDAFDKDKVYELIKQIYNDIKTENNKGG